MSYEYSSTSQNFDLPNPYRVQNLFVGITAAAALLIGFILLVILRPRLAEGLHGGTVLAGSVAILMLTVGLAGLSFVAMQLRFFFGRPLPERQLGGGADDTHRAECPTSPCGASAYDEG